MELGGLGCEVPNDSNAAFPGTRYVGRMAGIALPAPSAPEIKNIPESKLELLRLRYQMTDERLNHRGVIRFPPINGRKFDLLKMGADIDLAYPP